MDPQVSIPPWMAEARAHFERAQALYDETEEYEEALSECDAAIGLDPDLAEAHNLRGVLLEELDRPLEALQAYDQAVRANPRMQEAADNLRALREELNAGQELVTVATSGYPATAEVMKGKLEAAGIPAVVIGEEIVQTFWPQAMGGIKVQVREEDREAAIDVLGLREEFEQLEEEYWEDSEEAGERAEGGTSALGGNAGSATAEAGSATGGEEAELTELTQEAVAQPPEDDLLAQEAAAAPAPPQCPECGSQDVHDEKPSALASLLGIGRPESGKWICERCGHEWSEGDGTLPDQA